VKKLINDPGSVGQDALPGVEAAHPDRLLFKSARETLAD
jgi:hypothetical protein